MVPDAGKGHGFDLDAVVPAKDQKKVNRFIAFALGAATLRALLRKRLGRGIRELRTDLL